MKTTHTLETAEATLVYDVRGPLPPADGRPPLVMVGAPMDAGGFATFATYFPDRTVVTYDPRGLGRSTRSDGRDEHTAEQNAEDIHRVIDALGAGPVEVFASSGGAVSALALVAAHPDDVTTLVAHEPPLLSLLPDADRAFAAERSRAGDLSRRGVGPRHGRVHRHDVLAGRVHRRVRGPGPAGPGVLRDARGRTTATVRTRCCRESPTPSPPTARTSTPSQPPPPGWWSRSASSPRAS